MDTSAVTVKIIDKLNRINDAQLGRIDAGVIKSILDNVNQPQASARKDARCETCLAYDLVKGFCRAHPPTVAIDENGNDPVSLWPEVEAQEGCLEHAAIDDQPQAPAQDEMRAALVDILHFIGQAQTKDEAFQEFIDEWYPKIGDILHGVSK